MDRGLGHVGGRSLRVVMRVNEVSVKTMRGESAWLQQMAVSIAAAGAVVVARRLRRVDEMRVLVDEICRSNSYACP